MVDGRWYNWLSTLSYSGNSIRPYVVEGPSPHIISNISMYYDIEVYVI